MNQFNPERMVFGCQLLGSQINATYSRKVLNFCYENGICKFDLAERYPFPEKEDTVGNSEKIFGEWLKNIPREKVIVATKVTGRNNEGWYGLDSKRLTYNRIQSSIKIP